MIFGLAVAVFKHRFGTDLRTSFLEDLGQDRKLFPVRSDEGLNYLNKKRREEETEEARKENRKEKNKDLKSEFMIKWQSERFPIFFMFLQNNVKNALIITVLNIFLRTLTYYQMATLNPLVQMKV